MQSYKWIGRRERRGFSEGFKRLVLLEHLAVLIIASQMEVAPLHCAVDITQKRRLFKNTKEIEKM